MTNKIDIALWFDTNAKEAFDFYTTLFKDSYITQSNPVVTNAVLAGVSFSGINGGPMFKINPSISIMVTCETTEEVDTLWNALLENGSVLMPLDTYPWSKRYGWLCDKYGVTWQLYYGKLSDVNQQKLTPTLMFTQNQLGKCEEAIEYYRTIFPKFELQGILKYNNAEQQNLVQHAQFIANDFTFMATDGSANETFEFNEGVSFVILCSNQEEIDYYWNAFTKNGAESMCGWCKDAFGVSWQIIPENLNTLMANNPNAMAALMQMKKIIIKDLA